MSYNAEQHRRRSIRLKGYDYSQTGAYFVTLCTLGGACVFGEVVEGEMRLSEGGLVVADTWEWLAVQYPIVRLDAWVVMPNHLHGIIVIEDTPRRGGSRTAPTRDFGAAPVTGRQKPLGRLIGAFKTVSTKGLNELRQTPGMPLWQRNYYEHIIRRDESLDRIRQYILDNPMRWALDRENPLATMPQAEEPRCC